MFKQPSLPSSRSFPSLLSLSSSPTPTASSASPSAFSLLSSSRYGSSLGFPPASSSPSGSNLRRVNSDLCRLGPLPFLLSSSSASPIC